MGPIDIYLLRSSNFHPYKKWTSLALAGLRYRDGDVLYAFAPPGELGEGLEKKKNYWGKYEQAKESIDVSTIKLNL